MNKRSIFLAFALAISLPATTPAQKVTSDSQVVTKAPTTVSLSSTAAAVNIGTAVTFTATVSPTIPTVPTGTITFKATGQSTGTTSTASVAVSNAGIATWRIALSTIDTYTVSVAYSGDSNYEASAGSSSEVIAGAQDFTLTIPSTYSVRKGTSGAGALSLTPLNGFSGTVTLSCSGLPYGTTCGFNKQTITLQSSLLSSLASPLTSGNYAGAAVSTDMTLTAAGITVTTAGGFMLIGCLFGWRKRRRLGVILAFCTVATATLAITGCANSNRYTQNNGTPVGTYSVTVTATSGTLSHTATTTMTVTAQ